MPRRDTIAVRGDSSPQATPAGAVWLNEVQHVISERRDSWQPVPEWQRTSDASCPAERLSMMDTPVGRVLMTGVGEPKVAARPPGANSGRRPAVAARDKLPGVAAADAASRELTNKGRGSTGSGAKRGARGCNVRGCRSAGRGQAEK